MSETTPNDGNDRSKAKSSMSVSQQIVCEDEACIGKGETPETVKATQTAGMEQKAKGSTRSSMGVGGEEICSDEGCIGNK